MYRMHLKLTHAPIPPLPPSGFELLRLLSVCCSMVGVRLSAFGGALAAKEEHLLPLHVACGAGGEDAGAVVWHEEAFMRGTVMSSFGFGMAQATPPQSEL